MRRSLVSRPCTLKSLSTRASQKRTAQRSKLHSPSSHLWRCHELRSAGARSGSSKRPNSHTTRWSVIGCRRTKISSKPSSTVWSLSSKGATSKLKTLGQSVTLEESLLSGEHIHAHVYIHMEKEYRRKGVPIEFQFEGITPHVEPNVARGCAYKGAVNHGHFYVFVNKKGSLFSWANFEPFKDYQVEAWWLDNLLKHEKIDRGVYLSYASRVCVGFKRRLEDVRAAERYEKERAVVAHVEQEARNTSKELRGMKTYQAVETFIDMFKPDVVMFRRPILAIIGGTNLGKSMLARDVLHRVAAVLGLPARDGGPSFVEITVECQEHLDFADFDVRRHGGVLLDVVGDALILKTNREALQGRAKEAKGAQSATMVYSYKYTLARRAVIATFDLSAKNLDALSADHWLSCSLNVIQLRLHEGVVKA